MTNSPHDIAQHLTMWVEAVCSRCSVVKRIQGDRTRYSVGEYLIGKGWTASDDELVCPLHAQPVQEGVSAQAAGGD